MSELKERSDLLKEDVYSEDQGKIGWSIIWTQKTARF